MASSTVGSVTSGVSSGLVGARGASRSGSVSDGGILTSSGGSGVRSNTDGQGLRRQVVNLDGAELNTRAPRGTYLDITV